MATPKIGPCPSCTGHGHYWTYGFIGYGSCTRCPECEGMGVRLHTASGGTAWLPAMYPLKRCKTGCSAMIPAKPVTEVIMLEEE